MESSLQNGYRKVPSKDLDCSNEHQPGNSQGRFCSRHCKLVFTTVVLFLVILVAVLLAVKLKPHQVESSQPSVQALAGDAQIDADEGKWIPGLCWTEDASCRAPYCHYTYTDIPVLESLHQIPKYRDCPYQKEGCDLVKCNEHVGCLKCNQIKAEVEKNTYKCDDTLKCCHALTFMNECLNSTRNRTNHITSLFCSNDESHEMPKNQCSPGWNGDSCNQTRSRNITCKCYKSWSNNFCINYTNCSEMTYVENLSFLCQKNNLTHCLDESKVCRSQSMGGDQCLCDIKDKEPDDKDLCWRTDAPCRKQYCNKINGAFPVPALERLHKIDKSHSNCNGKNEEIEHALDECNDNHSVDNYDVAEKLLSKWCVTNIKCCHVKNYGQNYFNVSGNGNHQIASLLCEDYESHSPPIFQCQQGWGGKRCNETNQRKIDCRCFQSYSLCENDTDCSEMMYLDERKSLCSKHNLTHCEFESHVCRTKIQGKECLCNVNTQLAEDMKGQPGLINGAAILGPFTGLSTRNSIAFVMCLGLINLHQSR